MYYAMTAFAVFAISLQSCQKSSVKTNTDGTPPVANKASNLDRTGTQQGLPYMPFNDFTCSDGVHMTVVSTGPGVNGNAMYQNFFTGSVWHWQLIPGEATSITGSFDGTLYITNRLNDIFKSVDGGQTWQQLPGQASVIRCNNGQDGLFTMYCLGTTMADANGYHIYKWNISTQNWDTQLGTATKLAVQPDGTAWLVNAAGTIFRSDGHGGWTVMPGLATEIAAGGTSSSNNVVYCIGNTAKDANGNYIFRWENNGWTPVDGSAAKITVSGYGDIIVANNNYTFFIATPTTPFTFF